MNSILEIVLALLSGGVAVKVVEWWLNRRSVSFDEGTSLRNELREDLDRLRVEVTELRNDNTDWQRKYWELVRVNASQNLKIETLEGEVVTLKLEIKELLDRLRENEKELPPPVL